MNKSSNYRVKKKETSRHLYAFSEIINIISGVYSYLKENYSLGEMLDMTDEILTLKVHIMLGQALECILEKSIKDDKNQSLIAGICVQVGEHSKKVFSS